MPHTYSSLDRGESFISVTLADSGDLSSCPLLLLVHQAARLFDLVSRTREALPKYCLMAREGDGTMERSVWGFREILRRESQLADR